MPERPTSPSVLGPAALEDPRAGPGGAAPPSAAEFGARVARLKRERDAALLAHNFQYPEVQDAADFRGDSLELAFAAGRLAQPNIVVAGVDFMAETVKILNPEKRVFIPDGRARCPMAGMADAEGLRLMRERYPDAAVVAYVNSTAEVKAAADVCCASANAVSVCRHLDARTIIFTPDQNTGLYLRRKVPEKEFVMWPGYCHVHQKMTAGQVMALKRELPGAEVLVHPECPPDVMAVADHVFSTSGMLRHCKGSAKRQFIIGTERELLHSLKRENPGKHFYALGHAVCPTHKRITAGKVLSTMESLLPEVTLDPEVARKARASVDRMMEFAPQE